MPGKPKLVLKGHKALIRKMKRLGNKRKLKKVLRRATNAGATPVVKAVRAEWPEDSGLSKRSVTKKVVSTKSGYTAIIGVDKDAAGTSHGRVHVPSNIDHLVELGYQTEDGTTVPARAPLRRGYDNAKSDAVAAFERKAAEEVEKEARKP